MVRQYHIGGKPARRGRKLVVVTLLSLIIFGGVVYVVLQQA